MPNADTTTTKLRRAIRAYMRSQYSQNYPDSTLRGMVLGLTAEAVEAEFAEAQTMREARAFNPNLGASFAEHTPAPTKPEVDPVAAMVQTALETPAQQVREHRNFGACRIMGTYVRTTATGYTYRDSTGRARRSVFNRQRQFAGEALPRPHIEPCGNCPENRDPRACIHGRVGMCESCLSM